ncbi:MAG: dihydroorotase, partial [Clostridiales bacterium]|nr:dihydroorotase [Clostridiales bacterium]
MLLIMNGRIIAPGIKTDHMAGLFIKDGIITPLSELPDDRRALTVLDAAGSFIAPGLVDMHVHFRDPGFLYKEDLMTGAAAAAAGGVTTAACMPNTSPVIDNAEAIADIISRAKAAPVTILPYAAVTLGQKGQALTDAAALKAAGAAALSDDGMPVMNAALLREAMKTAQAHDMLIISHCEVEELVKNYAVNEGAVSEKLGIPGRPAVAEALMVMRDVMLAKETGARLHIAHVSTAGSVEIIRRAKTDGVRVTAETCPQYFTLTEDAVLTQGSMARINPPLRTRQDVDAVLDGLLDGTIDAVATDHAPHSAAEKALPLEKAPSGMVGLETSLALTLTMLYHTGRLPLGRIVELMSTAPSKILGINKGRLDTGC